MTTALRTQPPLGKKMLNTRRKEACDSTIAQIAINCPKNERVEVARINGLGSLVEQYELQGDTS